jgi:hypothetical protein
MYFMERADTQVRPYNNICYNRRVGAQAPVTRAKLANGLLAIRPYERFGVNKMHPEDSCLWDYRFVQPTVLVSARRQTD